MIRHRIAALARMIARGAPRRRVHRRRHQHRVRHSRFPQPRRDLDTDGADLFRRVPRLGGGAARDLATPLRDGGHFRRPNPIAATAPSMRWCGAARSAPSSRRISTGCTRPPASRPRRSSSCTATRPMRPASIAASATRSPICARFSTRGRCRPATRCLGHVKTATVSFGQSMPPLAMNAPRRRGQPTSSSCSARPSWFIRRQDSGIREAQRRKVRHRQPREDAARPDGRSGIARRDRRYMGGAVGVEYRTEKRTGRRRVVEGQNAIGEQGRADHRSRLGDGGEHGPHFRARGRQGRVADMLEEEGGQSPRIARPTERRCIRIST